jgi:hypothetical protein
MAKNEAYASRRFYSAKIGCFGTSDFAQNRYSYSGYRHYADFRQEIDRMHLYFSTPFLS